MKIKTLIPAIVIVGLGAFYVAGRDSLETLVGGGAEDLGASVGTIPLVAGDGQALTLNDLRGKHTVLFFGYTSCPDVCPLSLSYAAREYHRLGQYQDQVRVVFVSVDPERDTVAKVGPYTQYFNPAFVGLTGEPDRIAALAKGLNAGFSKNESSSALGYLMTHSSDFFIIDPALRLVRRLHPPHEPGLVSGALLSLLGGRAS